MKTYRQRSRVFMRTPYELTTLRRTIAFPLAAVTAITFVGCSSGKPEPTANGDDLADFFATIPAVYISDESIYSPDGDMRAQLPEHWIVLAAEKLERPNVFALACDPEYTMSLLFGEVRLEEGYKEAFKQGGMGAVLALNFKTRSERLIAPAAVIGEPEVMTFGGKTFGAYAYSTDEGTTVTRVALFATKNHLYECVLTHLTFRNRLLPTPERLAQIHRIVLQSIEW